MAVMGAGLGKCLVPQARMGMEPAGGSGGERGSSLGEVGSRGGSIKQRLGRGRHK